MEPNFLWSLSEGPSLPLSAPSRTFCHLPVCCTHPPRLPSPLSRPVSPLLLAHQAQQPCFPRKRSPGSLILLKAQLLMRHHTTGDGHVSTQGQGQQPPCCGPHVPGLQLPVRTPPTGTVHPRSLPICSLPCRPYLLAAWRNMGFTFSWETHPFAKSFYTSELNIVVLLPHFPLCVLSCGGGWGEQGGHKERPAETQPLPCTKEEGGLGRWVAMETPGEESQVTQTRPLPGLSASTTATCPGGLSRPF